MAIAHLGGVDLYYEVHGSGEPVLLIPGLGSDAGTWASFLPLLQGYQAFILENRGSVRSGKPAGDYSIERMAEDAALFLDRMGIQRAHVLGKSMGGMIAQVLAARYPQRVRSLVLASTVLKHDLYGEELLELGRMIAENAGLSATFRQAFLLSYSREYCMTNRSRLMEVEELLKQIDSAEVLRGYLGQSIACQKHDATSLAHLIQAPALVIVGSEDVITPPAASREVAAAIPNAELIIFPCGGHGFWREFPEKVNPVVLRFLSRH
jgi:pimeloyl-ACP methyl ester carboxylesterase